MNALIKAAAAKLNARARELFDAEAIQRVAAQHQQQYPGSWQNHSPETMGAYIGRILNKAAAKRETSAARIVLLCA